MSGLVHKGTSVAQETASHPYIIKCLWTRLWPSNPFVTSPLLLQGCSADWGGGSRREEPRHWVGVASTGWALLLSDVDVD